MSLRVLTPGVALVSDLCDCCSTIAEYNEGHERCCNEGCDCCPTAFAHDYLAREYDDDIARDLGLVRKDGTIGRVTESPFTVWVEDSEGELRPQYLGAL